MIHAIIILTIFQILTLIVLIIVIKELNTEIEDRQNYQNKTKELIKLVEQKDKIIYSQKVNLKHLNKLIKK